MARQVLENGVILPAEYSDDWYDDMTSNLTKLDDVIGSDSEKLSSADVGAAALSNNYNDLDNLPTIPTVNDATLTIQKNGVDVQTFTANASSNVTANITVPTKTSDLTNDSNFVDTSNSAVASGITSAKVTAYDSHVADTDIHVTTADKTKWNNNVTQSYVFRYSSTALVASSTNSNNLLDNTDNLKVGDKVIDSSGVLFSITAIDTANSTFTIGSALIDLALDANVVHTSGNETVGGNKIFTDNISLKSLTAEYTVTGASISVTYSDKNGLLLAQNKLGNYQSGISYNKFSIFAYDSNNQLIDRTLTYSSSSSTLATAYLRPDNDNIVSLGTSGNRWSKVYATNYYYGSDNTEFSTKFVTTDTNQTITGVKTFSSNTLIYNSDNTANTPNLILQSSKIQLGDTSNSDTQGVIFNAGSSYVAKVDSYKDGSGTQNLQYRVRTKDTSNNIISAMYRLRMFNTGTAVLESESDNQISLGRSSLKWKDVNTYLVNGLTPSSLGMPSGTLADQIDISSYFANTGTGEENSYTASANGWIYLRLGSISSCQAGIYDANNNRMWGQSVTGSVEQITVPILKGQTLTTQWGTSSTVSVVNARFIPCQGNI